VKVEAWRVEVTVAIPRGIRYALPLHEPSGTRTPGYENAHLAKPPKKLKYAGQTKVRRTEELVYLDALACRGIER
jgi:hypothetical protein